MVARCKEGKLSAVCRVPQSVVTDLDAHIAEKMYVVLRELKRAERVLVEPRGNGECNDVHSNCPLWALRGECSKNPKYMLSHCKSSCGACSAAEGGREPPHKRLQAAALQRILDETCKEFSPCRPRGQSSDRAPAKQAPSFHERVLRHELSRPDPPMPPLAEEVPGGGAEEDPALLLEELIAQDIGDLANKCIYLNQGWWTYQLCYKRSIRQIHIEDREVKVQHELGTFHTAFTLEANQRGPEILDAEDLMPEMSLPLPFVKHIFTGAPSGADAQPFTFRRPAQTRQPLLLLKAFSHPGSSSWGMEAARSALTKGRSGFPTHPSSECRFPLLADGSQCEGTELRREAELRIACSLSE